MKKISTGGSQWFAKSFSSTLLEDENPVAARHLFGENIDIPIETLRVSPLASIISDSGAAGPPETMKRIRNLPTRELRMAAWNSMAKACYPGASALAIQAESELPNTEESLSFIKKAAVSLAGAEDPYSIAEQCTDIYQRVAIVGGITQGLYQNKGVDGLMSAIHQGQSSGNLEWLEAASSVILFSEGPASDDGRFADLEQSMPQDAAVALTNYADANWPPEKAATLRGKLGSARQ